MPYRGAAVKLARIARETVRLISLFGAVALVVWQMPDRAPAPDRQIAFSPDTAGRQTGGR